MRNSRNNKEETEKILLNHQARKANPRKRSLDGDLSNKLGWLRKIPMPKSYDVMAWVLGRVIPRGSRALIMNYLALHLTDSV